MSTKLIEENGLTESIKGLLSMVPTSLKIELETEYQQEAISNFVGGNIFRIIQEALNNTLKHANAESFFVSIHQSKDIIHITLSDDGKGYDPSQIKNSNGLKNIEQRVASCNGIVRVYSKENMGTTITIKLPPH